MLQIVILLILTSFGLASYLDVYSPSQLESVKALMPEFSWTMGTSRPEPGTEASGAILGNNIYIMGGDDSDERLTNAVRVYDSATDSWSVSAPLPIPLDHAGSAIHNGNIYVVGGFVEGRKPTDSLLIYDPITNTWRNGKPLPEPRGALTAEFINGTLYALGGVDTTHSPVSTNEAYDPSTNTWTEKAAMPTARHHHTSAVVEDKLYVIGGRLLGNGVESRSNEALSNLNDNEMYNPLNDSWTVMEQMPSKRSGIAGAASPVDDNIYVFGGQGLEGALDTVEKFDPKSNQWTTVEPMPTARLGSEAFPLDNKIFVIGGKTDIGPFVTGLNEIFHIETNSTDG
jgi:N-acetylneuraminic acid mutarotase